MSERKIFVRVDGDWFRTPHSGEDMIYYFASKSGTTIDALIDGEDVLIPIAKIQAYTIREVDELS